MILQALREYYGRKKNDQDANMPQYGFGREQIKYRLVINLDGSFCGFNPCEEHERIEVPIDPRVGKSGTDPIPSFLCGSTEYIFGVMPRKKYKPKTLEKRGENAQKGFMELNRKICNSIPNDMAARAILKFLGCTDTIWEEHKNEFEKAGDAKCLLVLSNEGELEYVQNRKAFKEAWLSYLEQPLEKEGRERKKARREKNEKTAFCLVTGRELKDSQIARLHQPKIIGVGKKPGPTSPACIVSFDDPAFCSYGKTPDGRGMNAPVSEEAVAAYTAALNHLLDWKNGQTIRIGDAQTVLWAAVPTKMEQAAPSLLGGIEPQMKDDPGKAKEIKDYMEAITKGTLAKLEAKPDTRYYILGLNQPNKSRIAIRFWFVTTVLELAQRLKEHLDDMKIESHFTDVKLPSIWKIINETLKKKKDEKTERWKIIEKLDTNDSKVKEIAGDLIRSIITGADYPTSLLWKMLDRMRSDGDVNFTRVSMIKGILARQIRKGTNKKFKKEALMALDENYKEKAYLLGRLFAAFERSQLAYHYAKRKKKLKTTIKDRYFGSASATPCAVFPVINRLTQHHLSEAKWVEPVITQICDLLNAEKPAFPKTLKLDEQGLFVLGYYHQREKLWKKKSEEVPEETELQEESPEEIEEDE